MFYPCPRKGRIGAIGLLLTIALCGAEAPLAACAGAPNTTVPCDEFTPIQRPELPLYAQAKSLARQLSLAEFGSYHKRRGEQAEWAGGSANRLPGQGGARNWLRLNYRDAQLGWRGDTPNNFDGHLSSFQLGGNIYSAPSCRGSQELGLFAGSSRASGKVSSPANSNDGNRIYSGRNDLRSHYIGGYFTDYSLDQSYLDVMIKIAYLELDSRSSRGLGDRIYGPQLSVSVEKGFTLNLSEGINLEPQLQMVANYTNFSAYRDGISRVEADVTPELTFRAGLRGYSTASRNRYYLYGNLWHTHGGGDGLFISNGSTLKNERRASWAEIGGGLLLFRHPLGNAYLNLGYQRSIDDLGWRSINANLGFTWAW